MAGNLHHGDNGSTLKATTVLAMLQWLGVKPSYSRPRVSDDKAYAESLFRTAKYQPEFPAKGFASLEEARAWAAQFVRWYNVEHRHSGIGYVSPAQQHAGDDYDILAARHDLYLKARERHPPHTQLDICRGRHAQPRTRLGGHKDNTTHRNSAVGCMNEAATILTRAGMQKQKSARRRVFAVSLAERAGFEPAVGITPRTLSRRVT